MNLKILLKNILSTYFILEQTLIPADIYSNFIKTLNSFNFSVNVVTNDNLATKELLYDLRDEYRTLPISTF